MAGVGSRFVSTVAKAHGCAADDAEELYYESWTVPLADVDAPRVDIVFFHGMSRIMAPLGKQVWLNCNFWFSC